MKIKLLSIFVLFFLVLFAIPGYCQTQMISITNLKYTNGSAISTGTPIQIAEGGTVSVTFNLGINNPGFALIQGGTLSVYSKLNSSTNIQHVSIFYGQNAISGSVSRQCTIELKSSHFPSGTGSIYAQFSPVNNSPILGTSVPVKTVPLITSNYIIGNQTVYQGDPVGSINGPTPNGGNGLYTYAWQQKIGSAGAWTNISGATGVTFQPTNLSVSTISYRRIVTSLFGTLTDTSNEITVTILPPAAPIQNNTISLNGSTILGSLPTGGSGTYEYSWQFTSDEIGGTYDFHDEKGQNLELPSWVYTNAVGGVYSGLYVTRVVKSGNRVISSNKLWIPPFPVTENNTISLNGSTILGSLPTGGSGTYEYSWQFTSDEIGGTYDFHDEKGQNLELPSWVYTNAVGGVYSGLYVTRVVKSKNLPVSSNKLWIPPFPATENNVITLNGSTILGSLPTGGSGTYEYSWQFTSDEIGGTFEFPDEKGQNLELPSWVYDSNVVGSAYYGMYVTRVVKSKNLPVSSNTLKIPYSSNSNKIASNATNIQSDLAIEELTTVYPNPTSGSINFSTAFSTDKDIEITVYSENLKQVKSVFKGRVTPNQTVNWNVPSNYSKGVYFYKILSDNNEVKSGKFIFR